MIQPLTLDELRTLWPKTEDGALCARLLQRFLYTLLTETAAGADCAERAQAEAAANKTIATITRSLALLTSPPKPPAARQGMKPLRRFQGDLSQPDPETK